MPLWPRDQRFRNLWRRSAAFHIDLYSVASFALAKGPRGAIAALNRPANCGIKRVPP
jgi:hypothetical protein